MGIIKAAMTAVTGSLADQWLEVVEADDMSDTTVFCKGILTRRGQNVKGTADVVSNGSVIRVCPNQFMMLVDGGKVIDYTAEEGYYKVSNSASPSLFNGQFGETLIDSFDRIRFGGMTPKAQHVYFINLQEIKGIKFGTKTPVNYFDSFYNAELFLRAHGTYSIKITDPLRFFAEAVPRNAARVDIDDINVQYLNEFMEALQTAINQMAADGTRVSFVASKGHELSQYMADVLDEDWKKNRGMEIQSVGIASISYDEESQKLINFRNRGAMMSDPTVREGYVQSQIAEGIKSAGGNANGSMQGFMGIGMGMQAGGNFMGAASTANLQQMQMNDGNHDSGNPFGNAHSRRQQPAAEQQNPPHNVPGTAQTAGWTCSCGTLNTGKFCSECGKPRPQTNIPWTCSCGNINTGKFCSECGKPRP